VLVVVITTVGQDTVGLLARPSDLSRDWTPVEVFDQRDELGNVVMVPAGQSDREWDAARVYEQNGALSPCGHGLPGMAPSGAPQEHGHG
jgi:hypothetical protein